MRSYFSDVNVDYHVMHVAVYMYICMYVYLRALKSRKRTLVSDWIVDTDDAMSRVDCMLLSKLLKVLLLMIIISAITDSQQKVNG